MLELVISIAILVVLTGLLVPVVMNIYRSTKEKSYIIEAESVFDAMNLYVMDLSQKGPIDSFDLTEAFSMSLSKQTHVLRPYMGGKITKNAYIYGFQYYEYEVRIGYLEYMVSGYLIKVNADSRTEILKRPDK